MGLKDLLARATAAGGGMRGGGAPPPMGPEGAPEEMPPEMMAEEGAPPPDEGMGEPGDLDTALAGIESAIAELSPEAQEEIRSHINAIRDIAAGGEGEAAPEEMPPAPEAPIEEPPAPKSSESQIP